MHDKRTERDLKAHEKKYQRVCKMCGEFIDMYPASEETWTYKTKMGFKNIIFCSYTCMNRFDKKYKIKKYCEYGGDDYEY